MKITSKMYCSICDKELFVGDDYGIVQITEITHPFKQDKYSSSMFDITYPFCDECNKKITKKIQKCVAKQRIEKNKE